MASGQRLSPRRLEENSPGFWVLAHVVTHRGRGGILEGASSLRPQHCSCLQDSRYIRSAASSPSAKSYLVQPKARGREVQAGSKASVLLSTETIYNSNVSAQLVGGVAEPGDPVPLDRGFAL